jgi:putative methionine-R-sulfoxide reductase with GAF domain
VDSPVAGRFDEADARGLESLAALLVSASKARPAR